MYAANIETNRVSGWELNSVIWELQDALATLTYGHEI